MLILSPSQKKALDSILAWYQDANRDRQFITLGGYAGTGKTTIMSALRKELGTIHPDLKIGFVSYTGKATRVLKNTLITQASLEKQDTVSTIHSLIYSPVVDDNEEIVGWDLKEQIDRQLLVVDEGSMVDSDIWRHLLSYKVPIVVIGDHGQLPPIGGSFNILEHPRLILEEIHRQARENPIIGLSIQARTYGMIRAGRYSDTVMKLTHEDIDRQDVMNDVLENYTPDMLILCGYNTTRRKLNAHIRASLGFESAEPLSGDRVICLRNNHKKNIFNGMLGTIETIESYDSTYYKATIAMDDEEDLFSGLIAKAQFTSDTALNFTEKRREFMGGDLFDFGYALTVHKAQGSQAKKVILFEERFKQMTDEEWKRWLYTAVTRAQEELIIFG